MLTVPSVLLVTSPLIFDLLPSASSIADVNVPSCNSCVSGSLGFTELVSVSCLTVSGFLLSAAFNCLSKSTMLSASNDWSPILHLYLSPILANLPSGYNTFKPANSSCFSLDAFTSLVSFGVSVPPAPSDFPPPPPIPKKPSIVPNIDVPIPIPSIVFVNPDIPSEPSQQLSYIPQLLPNMLLLMTVVLLGKTFTLPIPRICPAFKLYVNDWRTPPDHPLTP